MHYIGRAVMLLLTLNGWAIDTTEAFDLGFSDIEFYSGQTQVGANRPLFSETTFGYGVSERLSFSIGHSYDQESSEDVLSSAIFFNALDRDWFHFDLMGAVDETGTTAIMAETNLDFQGWGFQLGVETVFEEVPSLDAKTSVPPSIEDDSTVSTTLTPLIYVQAGSRVQLLAAANIELPSAPTESWDQTCLCLGVNVLIKDNLELITDITHTAHAEMGHNGWGASIGFITTL